MREQRIGSTGAIVVVEDVLLHFPWGEVASPGGQLAIRIVVARDHELHRSPF